jgi:hypothetical protein
VPFFNPPKPIYLPTYLHINFDNNNPLKKIKYKIDLVKWSIIYYSNN